jgi:aminopeptidase N
MNHLLRTCKCHWEGGENLHWGRTLERRPFVPPGTAPRFAPDPGITSRHLRLELHLDFTAERAWGETTHNCEVRVAEARSVRFDAVNLEIGRVRVNGRGAAFDHDGAGVTVTLPRRFKQGNTFQVAITHAVTRPVAGLYFTNPDPAYPERFQTVWSQGQDEDSRYYFPCLDAPRFKQTSEVLLYVPQGCFALSNGELVAHRERAGKGESLWHYRLDLPYSTYLLSVVAGRFARHVEKARGVEVRWFVQPGREGEARNAFGSTGEILRFLGEFTGVPYPFKQYTQIAVPEFIFGGMENFTVTTQTDLTLHDDRAHLDFSSDDLVAHEAAHSWFGNLVTARNWSHAWLHESFATYLEALYQRHARGEDEFDYQMLRDAEAYFHEDGQYRRPIVTERYESPIDLFDAHLYPGGAVRLRHLHALLGDGPFRASLRRFLETHRFGVAETVDLARAIELETGVNHDGWFEQWLFCGGYPALEITYAWRAEERLAELTVRQTQPLADPGGDAKHKRFFRLPAKVLFQVGNRPEVFPLTLEGEEHRFVFRLERKPVMVLFDPDFECPAKKVTYRKPQHLLLHELQHAPRPVARIEAANGLAEKPARHVVAALERQLKREPFWGVQQRIARVLGRIGGEAARDVLVWALRLPHPKARREVVATLGHFKDDPRVAESLARHARRGDPSYYVEAELARALGRCRAPRARTLLEGFLERPSHAEVIRGGAFDGLGELGDPETLPLLGEGLRYGAPALSRLAAIRAAADLGRRHLHLHPAVLDMLGAVAEHRDRPAATFRGKLAAMRGLERLGDLEALPLLRRVAEQEVDGRLVRLARLSADQLRRQASKPAELHGLREDLTLAFKENKSLRERVDVLEQTGKQTGKQTGRQSAAGRPSTKGKRRAGARGRARPRA